MIPTPILVQAEMAASPSPAAPRVTDEVQSPELPALCEACGMHHGSLGAELQCLRHFVRTLRELAQRK